MSGPTVSGALPSVLPPAMDTLPFVAADERPGQSELTKDWNWDSEAFTASPKDTGKVFTAQCRAPKRQKILRDVVASEAAPESPAASLRLSAEEPSRSHSSASDEQAALQGEPAAGAPGRVAVPGGPACQVEGCDRDLAALSAYHQKCRVCDLHIKAPSFARAGLLQRFCQRCGRCHELGAFEGTRRSCRAQLAKHNARRRRQAGNAHQADDLQRAPSGLQDSLLMHAMSSCVPSPASLAYQGIFAPDVALGIPVSMQEPGLGLGMGSSSAVPMSSMDQALMQMGHPAGPAAALHAGMYEQAAGLPGSSAMLHGAVQSQVQPVTPAAALQAGLPPAAAYQASSLVVRLSVKIFNCTPGELPQGLREQLCGWLCATPAGAEGYIRPGCVHLTVQARVDAGSEAAADDGMLTVVERMLGEGSGLWRSKKVALQSGSELALVEGGGLQSVASTGDLQEEGEVPHICEVHPRVLSAPSTSGESCVLHLLGQGLDGQSTTLLARANGSYADIEVEAEVQFGGQTEMRLRLHGVKPGLLWLEAQKGSLLSGACPVVVLPAGHANLAAEVACLVSQPGEVACHAAQLSLSAAGSSRDSENRMHSDECCDSFLADLGLVLQRGVHSSSAASDLAHAWQCCVDERQESCGVSCCHSVSMGAASLVVRVAHDLLAFACDAGAPALASFVLPTASLGCASAEALVAALEGKKESSGSTLLHRALRSKSTAMVEGLLAWGDHTSYQWQADARDCFGLTPLHLAAIAPDDSLAERVLQACACGPSTWFTAAATDGLTPAHFAARLGRHCLNARILRLAQANKETSPGRKAGGCGCTCGDNCTCSTTGVCRCAAASDLLCGGCHPFAQNTVVTPGGTA